MSEREKIETETGFRYTILLELPYYDSVRMVIVDPMHNLFLGTAKHFIVQLKNRGLLSSEDLEKINSEMNQIKPYCPEDVGRIPLEFKISEKESLESLTADQMKKKKKN